MDNMTGIWEHHWLTLFSGRHQCRCVDIHAFEGGIMDSSAPDSLHALLAKTFAELGAIGPVVRSLLLRDRFYAGQKFRCEGVQAVLLAGGNKISFTTRVARC